MGHLHLHEFQTLMASRRAGNAPGQPHSIMDQLKSRSVLRRSASPSVASDHRSAWSAGRHGRLGTERPPAARSVPGGRSPSPPGTNAARNAPWGDEKAEKAGRVRYWQYGQAEK